MTTPIPTRLAIDALSAISLRDGDKPVLRRVSLSVRNGEVHGLVGESGAGKSTIAKAVLGIIPSQVKVTGGSIVFEGRDLLALRPGELREILGRDIALVPQDPSTALNPARRIDAQMTDGLRLKRGLSAKQARIRARALLEEVQIRDPDRVLKSYPHQLSGGMRQRVAIARGLVEDPKILLMDEPFAALDEQTRTKMGGELLQIWERSRKTILFITHGLTEAIFLADTVMVMQARPGRIVERIEVELPRPRTYDMIGSEYFGRVRNRIWHLLAEQVP